MNGVGRFSQRGFKIGSETMKQVSELAGTRPSLSAGSRQRASLARVLKP